jgi:DNA topoisomerase IA
VLGGPQSPIAKLTNHSAVITEFVIKSATHHHVVTKGEMTNHQVDAPSAFSTSSLQQSAYSELQQSPINTMKSAQELYEAGLITYMRTESTTINDEFMATIATFIGKRWCDRLVKIGPPQLVAAAHEAIRPTNIEISCAVDPISNAAIKLYKLIWSRTIESCMIPGQYTKQKYSIIAPEIGYFQGCGWDNIDPSTLYNAVYNHSRETTIERGWRIVRGMIDVAGEDGVMAKYMVLDGSVMTGKPIKCMNIKCKEVGQLERGGSSRPSEARLVGMMEKIGIGRPSTYATLIDTIKSRKYISIENIKGIEMECSETEWNGSAIETGIGVTKTCMTMVGNESKRCIPTPLGSAVIDFTNVWYTALFNYGYTAEMEMRLDDISNGKCTKLQICSEMDELLTTLEGGVQQSDGVANPPLPPCVGGSPQTPTVINSTPNWQMGSGGTPAQGVGGVLHPPLGRYHNEDLFVYKGKYGYYAKWGEKTSSLKRMNIPLGKMTFDGVVQWIESGNGVPKKKKWIKKPK